MIELNYSYTATPGESNAIESTPRAEAELPNEDALWHPLLAGGTTSETGEPITPLKALSHGPVWQAVNVLAGDVGQLPLHKMKRTGRNREKDRKHNLWQLLTVQPNNFQTPGRFKENMMLAALLWGNGCALIVRDNRGRIEQLLPLRPDKTKPVTVDGDRMIETWAGGQSFLFHYREIFHIPGLAVDGFWGISAAKHCVNVIGHGLALRKYGNALMRDGAQPAGVLQHPGTLDKPTRRDLRNEWNLKHGGVDNAGKVAILMEGMTYSPTSLSNVDAQYLESVKLDPVQIAGLFGLPPHKLNSLENMATKANVEELNRNYLDTSLGRWLLRFVEEGAVKLLTDKEVATGDHYLKWQTAAMLRGDVNTRYTVYSLGIQSTILSPNECREFEDMNPYEGGDDYANPAITVKETTPEQDNQKDQQAKALEVLTAQAKGLLTSEANQVNRAAKETKNFVRWLDKYYQDYEAKAAEYLAASCGLCDLVGLASTWRPAIAEHTDRSHAALLRASDAAPGDLCDRVKKYTETLRTGADDLVQTITGRQSDENHLD